MISLKSQITLKVLNYYFLNAHARHYINELARLLEVDPKNLQRKLKELEKEGILQSEFLGKQRYFFIAKPNPVLKSYRQLVLNTAGIEAQLRKALNTVTALKKAFIFGSYAKNKMDAGSDIDVLAVGGHSILELQKAINRIQKQSGREINVVNMGLREFDQKKREGSPFLKQVFLGKVIKLI